MNHANDLPTINDGILSERELVDAYLMDIGRYNDLANQHNTLVDHIKKYCQ